MIKKSRGGKLVYVFTEDQLKAYKCISSVISSSSGVPVDALQTTSKKRSPKQIGFLKPVKANDGVVSLIDLVSHLDPNLTLNNTHVSSDGSITTCYSDIKTCLSKYINESNCKSGDYIVLDANLVDILGEEFLDEELKHGRLEVVGDDLYMHKSNGGKPSKLASRLYKR